MSYPKVIQVGLLTVTVPSAEEEARFVAALTPEPPLAPVPTSVLVVEPKPKKKK